MTTASDVLEDKRRQVACKLSRYFEPIGRGWDALLAEIAEADERRLDELAAELKDVAQKRAAFWRKPTDR